MKTYINNKIEEKSYIAHIPRRGTIAIRKQWTQMGYVKISIPTEDEIEKEINKRTKSVELELSLLKKQKELQNHLNKLRKLRNERNN